LRVSAHAQQGFGGLPSSGGFGNASSFEELMGQDKGTTVELDIVLTP